MYHPGLGAPGEGREDVHDVARAERCVIVDVMTVHEDDTGQLSWNAEYSDEVPDAGSLGDVHRRNPLARSGRQIPGQGRVQLDRKLDQRGAATRRRSPGRIESWRSRLFRRRTSPALIP